MSTKSWRVLERSGPRLMCIVGFVWGHGRAARSDHHPCFRAAFDDGREQLLLCLHGLIPITFRQSSYNIPIILWLTLNYPRDPPITYVVPTSDMLVKPSKDVDVSGRCQISYVKDWERKSEVRKASRPSRSLGG